MSNDTKEKIDAHEVGPSPDCADFAIGAVTALDVSSIGGYPVRKIEVLVGSGTLNVRTATSGTTNRSLAVAVGTKIEPLQILSIRGTSDGTSGGLTVRVYK